MQTADSIIFYRCPLSSRALDMVNVCLFGSVHSYDSVWTYDPDLTDIVFGVEEKSDGSRESLVEGIALNERRRWWEPA